MKGASSSMENKAANYMLTRCLDVLIVLRKILFQDAAVLFLSFLIHLCGV